MVGPFLLSPCVTRPHYKKFALVRVFHKDAVLCDYLMEVAGLRHVPDSDVKHNHVGDAVTIEVDLANPVDQDALLVTFHRLKKSSPPLWDHLAQPHTGAIGGVENQGLLWGPYSINDNPPLVPPAAPSDSPAILNDPSSACLPACFSSRVMRRRRLFCESALRNASSSVMRPSL